MNTVIKSSGLTQLLNDHLMITDIIWNLPLILGLWKLLGFICCASGHLIWLQWLWWHFHPPGNKKLRFCNNFVANFFYLSLNFIFMCYFFIALYYLMPAIFIVVGFILLLFFLFFPLLHSFTVLQFCLV